MRSLTILLRVGLLRAGLLRVGLLGVVLLGMSAFAGLGAANEDPPRIRITAPRGGQTKARLVTIQGEVSGIEAERLSLVLNGVALSIPRQEQAFSTQQVLAPGWNTIRVVAEEKGVAASDEVAVYAMVPQKDLRVALTWDTNATDIDLWVTGPDGEKIYYQNKQGKAGGTLDTDVTTGFGPETYTQARAQAGTYRVQAHYYGGSIPTRVTVTVIRGEGTESEERSVFRGVLLKPGDVGQVGEFVVSR